MLEGLDNVNWAKLGHAYGDASDVPGLLRQLAFGFSEDRAKAIHAFHGNIWHQGTVYEATAPTVPFLIELLQAPTIADKDQILILLSHLANGSSYHAVHEQMLQHSKARDTPEWQEQKSRELVWVEDAKKAVVEGKPTYLELLAHAMAIVREAAAYLLAALEEPSPDTAMALWNRFECETVERCRASLLLGFGRLAQPDPMTHSLLLNAFLQAGPAVERLAAALSLARLFPAELPRDAAQEILRAIYNPAPYAELDSSPWGIHGMELTLEYAVLRLKGEAGELVVRELEKTLADAGHPAALNSARLMLAMAFPESLPKEAAMESLNDLQRRVIRLMAVNRNAWVKSVAGARAKAPDEAVVFSLRSTDLPLKRLLCEAAMEAGTFPKDRQSFWGTVRRRLGAKTSNNQGP